MKNSGGNKKITDTKCEKTNKTNKQNNINNYYNIKNNFNNNFSIDINLELNSAQNNSKNKPIIFSSKKIPSKEKNKQKAENSLAKTKNKNVKKDSKAKEAKKGKICLDESSNDDSNISFNLNLNEEKENNYLNNKKEAETEKEIKPQIPELNLAALAECLTCPLCKGIFRNPYTISECMDTFCKRCIFRFKDENSKKPFCPICKIDFNGKVLESLMPNSQLSLVINAFFPEFEVIDKEEKVIISIFEFY